MPFQEETVLRVMLELEQLQQSASFVDKRQRACRFTLDFDKLESNSSGSDIHSGSSLSYLDSTSRAKSPEIRSPRDRPYSSRTSVTVADDDGQPDVTITVTTLKSSDRRLGKKSGSFSGSRTGSMRALSDPKVEAKSSRREQSENAETKQSKDSVAASQSKGPGTLNQSKDSVATGHSKGPGTPNQSKQSVETSHSKGPGTPNQSKESFTPNQSRGSGSSNASRESFTPNQSRGPATPNASKESFTPNQSRVPGSSNASRESFAASPFKVPPTPNPSKYSVGTDESKHAIASNQSKGSVTSKGSNKGVKSEVSGDVIGVESGQGSRERFQTSRKNTTDPSMKGKISTNTSKVSFAPQSGTPSQAVTPKSSALETKRGALQPPSSGQSGEDLQADAWDSTTPMDRRSSSNSSDDSYLDGEDDEVVEVDFVISDS